MIRLPYEELVSPEFGAKVRKIASLLSIRPEWLMVVMAIETGRKFKANVKNPYTGAVGLIQFMPTTAVGLDTTIQELESMTEVQQMDYVYKHLKMYKSRISRFEDVYLAVFYPAAVGKPDEYKFGTTPEMRKKIAMQNPAYDLNKDMVVTKAEVRAAIEKFIPKGYEESFR